LGVSPNQACGGVRAVGNACARMRWHRDLELDVTGHDSKQAHRQHNLMLAAGTYTINGYLMPAARHKAICGERRTCVLTSDGANLGAFKVPAGTSNVTIKGFVVRDFGTPSTWPIGCMQVRDGGLMEDNEITGCYVGLTTESNTITHGNYVHHNRWAGLSGGPATGVLIENNEIAFNNTSHGDIGVDASGLKLIGSDGGTHVIFRGNYSHDNYGQGFWCDGNCKGSIVENNRIENNYGAGSIGRFPGM